jgi:high affinity Mn2+ porin
MAGCMMRAAPLLISCTLLLAAACRADEAQEGTEPAAAAVHGQATWIRQFKPAFHAPYTGPHSLVPQREWSYSFTTTLDLGVRPWHGAQLHLNPEGAEGFPLSRLTGAGGISNGELQRGSSLQLLTYRARMFFQQRVDLAGETERIEPDFNQIGGTAGKRRWTFTVGTISLLDYFDPNPYAKDPRTQFTSWAFLTHGAWDYPADARGYTSGAMADYTAPGWAFRFGRFMQPRQSNGLQLEHDLSREYGDQAEIEADLPWRISQAGPLRARGLVFRNRVDGARFTDAIAQAAGGIPDITAVRRLQAKRGWGLTLEAPLGPHEGLFVRASRNDGAVETYAFAEIDRQVAVGGQSTGARWGRPRDTWGVAYAVNGLSGPHRTYLALGGQAAFLGEGRLAYGTERIVEAYYRFALPDAGPLHSAVSAGVQHMRNPGYNTDRGPVQVWSLRWHADF